MSYSVKIALEADFTNDGLLNLFLGHYDMRIFVTDNAYFDVGAGSLGAFSRLTMIPTRHAAGKLGAIGRWCEFARDCEIMVTGEHDHDQPVNVTMATFRIFDSTATNIGLKNFTPVQIGSGVTISAQAMVLPGRRIGDGAVVGARALVTRDVEAFAIVGGSPAKLIRHRGPFQPWWDFDAGYLAQNMADIQTLAGSPGPHQWRAERPRFAVRANGGTYTVFGFIQDDAVRPLGEAPDRVQAYLNHVFGEKTPEIWLADCWAT